MIKPGNLSDKFRRWELTHSREDYGRCDAFIAGYKLAVEDQKKMTFISVTNGPIISENITIDARYHFEQEIKRLRSIILKELTENDELGAEYTYVLLLKEEISRLRKYEKVSENDDT